MIIDFTTHTDNQKSQLGAYFNVREEQRRNRYDLLPSCIKDFIQQYTGLYILIESMLNGSHVRKSHLSLAKNMIEQDKQMHIHSPKTAHADEYFQKLIEKAEYSTSPTAKELSKSIHSVECNLLSGNEENFKECWKRFIAFELNELIEEAS